MTPTRSRLPLDHSIRHALVDAVTLKLPPGQPMTLDMLEAAAVQLLRDLGPQLLEDVIAGVEAEALPAVAATPRSSKGCARARLSR